MYYEKLTDLGIKLFRRSGSEKTKCPQCCDGRKNKTDRPLSVNITTGEYNCHHCGWKGNVRSFERKRDVKKYEKPPTDVLRNIELKEKVVEWFETRGITQKTLDKFMIHCKEEWMPQTQQKENCICFPYFRDGEMVNVKYRDAHKNFKLFKDAELIFFNLSSVGDKKYCVLTEGEIDCMSVYEAGYGCEPMSDNDGVIQNEQYSKWSMVSVPNGAPPVPKDGKQYMPSLEYLDTCADWFIGLHEIIIATDNDEPGNLLKDELIRRLGVERCKIINYPLEEVVPVKGGKRRCKDMNEILQYLGKEVVINCIENAEFIPVDGVYYLEDIFPSMLQNFKKGIVLAPTTRFGEMDEYFRWKKGDINLCTGYGNHGKSLFMIQLMLVKSIYDGWKWAIFSPENYPANDFYDDIIEMYVGKWLNDMSENEYVDACSFVDKHIFYVYPEDAHDINSINEKFRHLVLKKGVDGVMVDPFNQLDHLQKPYQREDQYLSEILKDTKRFALLNNVSYNIIAHPRNPDRIPKGQPMPVVDMYDIAGGAMWGHKCDNILSYYRPNFHIDKNSPEVDVYVQKIKRKRTGGQLGHFSLTLNWARKRFSNSSGQMPCDPWRAKYLEEKSKEDYTQKPLEGFEPIDGEEF